VAPARLLPREMHFRVFLLAAALAGQPVTCSDASGQPPAPPVQLAWEDRPAGSPPRWRRLNGFEGGSAAFPREGDVLVEGPADPTPSVEGKVSDTRIWLRARLISGAYPAGGAPEIDFIRPNVVRAQNLATVGEEIVRRTDPPPSQATPDAFTSV